MALVVVADAMARGADSREQRARADRARPCAHEERRGAVRAASASSTPA
jgi:hypothetical protein